MLEQTFDEFEDNFAYDSIEYFARKQGHSDLDDQASFITFVKAERKFQIYYPGNIDVTAQNFNLEVYAVATKSDLSTVQSEV